MVPLLFLWLRLQEVNPTHVAEYHFEITNNCMRLLVGEGNDCSSSKMPKKGFSQLAPHPLLVVWYDMYESYILYVHFLIYFLLAIMLQRIDIRTKIGMLLNI